VGVAVDDHRVLLGRQQAWRSVTNAR
jgi:hypothetical protein